MSRWYQNTKNCYAYLPDVFRDDTGMHDEPLRLSWTPAFRKSRWFRRGWTLRELMASSSIKFFSKDGYKLGSKASLKVPPQEITSIALDAFKKASLSEFRASERMSWSRGRETKCQKNKAYSLLSILVISIYIDYGEGEKCAIARLRKKMDRQ